MLCQITYDRERKDYELVVPAQVVTDLHLCKPLASHKSGSSDSIIAIIFCANHIVNYPLPPRIKLGG